MKTIKPTNMKDNKLIAEFMGFPQQSDVVDDRTTAYYVGDVIKATNKNNQNEDDVFHPEDMMFDSSWDWLMPVIKKIEAKNHWFNRLDGDVTLVNDKGIIISTPMSDGGINMYYQTVIEFIKRTT